MGSSAFASGKNALAECDRCGFAYKYGELRPEVRNGVRLNIRVCSTCYDGDHPQELLLRRLNPLDPQGLKDARPQGNLAQQRTVQPSFSYGLFFEPRQTGQGVVTLPGVTQAAAGTVS